MLSDYQEAGAAESCEPTSELTVVPYTGEALLLADLSAAQLAEAIDDARLFEQSRLRAFKRALQDEVLRRMDADAAGGQPGAWTIRDGGWKLTGESPERSDYDVGELRAVLRSLADAGLIEELAIGEAIVPSGWKVARRPPAQRHRHQTAAMKTRAAGCRSPDLP